MLDSPDIEDGKITVELQEENVEIEARIRYEGFDSWSVWISPDQPVGREKLKIYSAHTSYFCLGPGRKNRRRERFDNSLLHWPYCTFHYMDICADNLLSEKEKVKTEIHYRKTK